MPEEKKFTFKQCYQLLQISPKSFLGWLSKEGIDPEKQRDRFDPRKKYLYKHQLELLAEKHDRTLPPLDDYEQDAESAPTIETLAEQLDLLHTEITGRLDQVEQTMLRLAPILEEIASNQQKSLTNVVDAPTWQHVAERLDQLEQVLREQAPLRTIAFHQDTAASAQGVLEAEPAEIASSASNVTRPTMKTSAAPGKSKARSKNKSVRGKKLPRTLIALRDFANQHHIAVERASAAGKSGKITIVHGKWLVNSRWAFEALGEQGQHDFYEIFYERTGFTPCEHCPHSLAAAMKAR